MIPRERTTLNIGLNSDLVTERAYRGSRSKWGEMRKEESWC